MFYLKTNKTENEIGGKKFHIKFDSRKKKKKKWTSRRSQ